LPRNGGHDYRRCRDEDCPRITCVAFRDGYDAGFDDGYGAGHAAGYEAGYAAGAAEAGE
jgi:hypothetical protein